MRPYHIIIIAYLSGIFFTSLLHAQVNNTWHGKQRELHYKPQGNDFVKVSGHRKFNRALYGTNTGFRVETGDLPELALYMPGMGGNCKIGIVVNNKSKWIAEADSITTIYRAGSMVYEISDALLGKGMISITVLAMANADGMIVKLDSKNIPAGMQMMIAYGGATGKKFSRDGDIGAGPESSFYLKPEYCRNNVFYTHKNIFHLYYGAAKPFTAEEITRIQTANTLPQRTTEKEYPKKITGVFPATATLKPADATKQESPVQLLASTAGLAPLITAIFSPAPGSSNYFLLRKPEENMPLLYDQLPGLFQQADAARKKLADRIMVYTPDAFINPLGSALSFAADAIWEDPSYFHGAVAWRMRLPAWRGAYAADPLGWHDRAQKHFSSYALSQVTKTAPGPVVSDTALHLARQLEKIGTAMFSEGYICRNPGGDIRPHHYDMNLVFVDQLLNHFNWNGDTNYVQEMWPLIERHLAWEKRNFDPDNDGLYDAYACIWASDALQYSGGGVTHSTAYNYRANKTAAQLATLIGKDGNAYRQEADKILGALNKKLWLKDKGWFAEYIDQEGLQLVHPSAGLWTVYHAMDAGVPDPTQQHQLLRYIDNHIPHIPVQAKGVKDEGYYLLSTTNWQPYTWSVNNVALAENLHTSLAYWQAGENENAFKLWKSALLESMYLSAGPGNFEQLSFYDAIRGELYRDFADPIGVAARTLVEGLFGVQPDALHNKLVIRPGLPASWNFAQLKIPDISIDYKQANNISTYTIIPSFSKSLSLNLQVKAKKDSIVSLVVNGKPASWKWLNAGPGAVFVDIEAGMQKKYTIAIKWFGNDLVNDAPLYSFPTQRITAKTVPPILFKENAVYETVDIQPYFNDQVTNIFKHQYLSPRPASVTLQLPWQGIGNWCYPLTEPLVNDSGTRKLAGTLNKIYLHKIPFATPSNSGASNILFTSRWDNFPDTATVPLSGKASHIYLLMAGTTNHQQSRMMNAKVVVRYTDGTADELPLLNPQNWWPIEQDYYEDGYAFTTDAPRPYRLILKTGEFVSSYDKYTPIKGFSNYGIDGGAATVLEIPLQSGKALKELSIIAIANEIVAGLMSATLVR